jgi:hypothetical protein
VHQDFTRSRPTKPWWLILRPWNVACLLRCCFVASSVRVGMAMAEEVVCGSEDVVDGAAFLEVGEQLVGIETCAISMIEVY